MSKDFNLKMVLSILLKTLPCLVLLYTSLNITSFLIKNIIFVLTSIYLVILLLKSNIIISSILAISYIIFASFNNLGIQKEITYLQLVQFSTLYLFSLYFSTNNKILKKTIKQKDNMINKDYITGLFNKRYLDELIMTNYSPKNKDTYMISLEVDNFSNIINNVGYSSSEIVLRDIGKILKKEIGKKGICFKLDGENFVIIIDKSKNIEIESLVDNIKNKIENTYFKLKNRDLNIIVNMSIISSKQFKNSYDYIDKSIKILKNAKYTQQGTYFEINDKQTNIKRYN